MTPNKRLTHLRGGFQEPQGMQYSYLGSFVSAVNNLRFCTRRVLEGTVHRTKIPLWSPSLRNSEKCLENLNLKIRNLKMPSKTQCLPRPYRTCTVTSIGPADVPGAWGFLFSILRIPICLQARVPYILGMYGYSTPKSPHCQHYFFSGSYPGIMGPSQCFGRFGFLSRF